jgi:uncharacterized oxidoreductase
MNMSGNTILVTGGSGGIGQALAEAFHALGNTVIITGRRQASLDSVTSANPGMTSYVLYVTDAGAIKAFADTVSTRHPDLNIVVNNAGIMVPETITADDYLATAEETIATNLLGPIRLTATLLPHLKSKPDATVMTVSSGLAFVPYVSTPTYSATKAGIHSYSMAIREQLKETSVKVVELAPPYVQTGLMGDFQKSDPNAMPLADFISEVIDILTKNPDAHEVIVERCKPLRFAAESGDFNTVFSRLNGAH